MNSVNRRLFGLVVIAAAMIVSNRHASADLVIYSENFSGAGTTDLNGTAPDTTTGGNTWTASTAWNKDGSVDAGAGADSAFLAFTPTADKVYTLSATLTQPSGGPWAAIGFTQSNVTNIDFWSGANLAQPWVLYRSSSNVDSFLGTGTGGSADEGDHAGPLTLSIVLDTTGAQWTAEWFVAGSSARTETFGSNPTSITHVGLGRVTGADTTFSDFSLTVVPEPSSFAMFAVVGLVSLGRRRKRKHVH